MFIIEHFFIKMSQFCIDILREFLGKNKSSLFQEILLYNPLKIRGYIC